MNKIIKKKLDLIFSEECEYEFVELYKQFNGKRNHNKIKFLHKTCGTVTDIFLHSFYSGTRCQNEKCKLDKSLEDIKNKVLEVLEDEYELKNIYRKIYNDKNIIYVKIKHKKCGTVTDISTGHFWRGTRCNNNDCIIGRRKFTVKEKYGVSNVMDDKNIKSKHNNKIKEICASGIWIDNNKSNEKQMIENYLTKYKPYYNQYKIKPLFKDEDYIGQTLKYKFECLECGINFEDNFDNLFPRCPKCNNHRYTENEIKDFILKETERTEYPKTERFYDNNDINKSYYELDIYLPEHNFGIEFNGLYYHSQITGNKDKYYHKNKTDFFNSKGIQIYQIFENEWKSKNKIIKSMIRSKLGNTKRIFARKCEIKDVSIKESKEFLNNSHIQGAIGSSIKLGLYYEEELVSILTLGKSRFNKNYEYELLRFASKIDTTVVGGFSKLLKYFIRNYNPTSIITYADKRYSNGNVYEKNGFTYLHDSDPNYFYTTHNLDLMSRVQFQKHKLKNKLKKFDENKTEWENMVENGYDRIWDCGNKVYLLDSIS